MESIEKILIAEDDPFLRKALGSFIEEEGVHIDYAKDGKEAIRLINKEEYRLIMLDINMPYKSGFDVLRKLQDKKDIPPVFIFSNFDTKESKDEAMSLGVSEYFVKHKVGINDLRMMVKLYLKGNIKKQLTKY